MEHQQKGTLEVITGCMSSGKSEELIRRAKRATIAKQKVIIFKHSMDTRSAKGFISSRCGKVAEAIEIKYPLDAIHFLGTEDLRVVCFDEAQFFDGLLVMISSLFLDRGKRVIVAGLDTDFRGEPFGEMPMLMALADKVDKMTAICVKCGKEATRTQRLIGGKPAKYDAPLIQVGGDEMYEARCRDCHEISKI